MKQSLRDFLADPPEPTHPSELQLDRWACGELTDDEASRLEAHVDTCPHCQATMQARRSLDAAYERIRRRRQGRRQALLALALAAGASGVGLLTGRSTGPALELREARGHLAKVMGTEPQTTGQRMLRYAASSPVAFVVAPAKGEAASIDIEIIGPDGRARAVPGSVRIERLGDGWFVSSEGRALFGHERGTYLVRVRGWRTGWGRAGPPLDIVVDFLGEVSSVDGDSGPHNTNAE